MGTDLTSDPKKLVKQETKNNNACLMLVDTKIRVPLKCESHIVTGNVHALQAFKHFTEANLCFHLSW